MLNSGQASIMLAEVRTLTEGFPVYVHIGRFPIVLGLRRGQGKGEESALSGHQST